MSAMPQTARQGLHFKDRHHLARTLRKRREDLGLTKQELERRAGLAKGLCSRLEDSGRGDLHLSVALRIARVLQIPLGSLVCEGDPAPAEPAADAG